MLHLADQAATITLNESCESILVLLLCIATCRPSVTELLVRRLCCCISLVAALFCYISACPQPRAAIMMIHCKRACKHGVAYTSSSLLPKPCLAL